MGQKMLFHVCLVVCAFAQVAELVTAKAALETTKDTSTTTNFNAGNTTKPVPILRQINKFNADGSYTYGFEGGDGSFKIETRDTLGRVHGKYGYVDEFGEVKIFEYGSKNSVVKVPKNESASAPKLPLVTQSSLEPKVRIQSDNSNLNTINSNKNHRKELVSAISKLLNIPNPQPAVTVQPESTTVSKLIDTPKSNVSPKVAVIQSEILDFNTIKSRPLPQFTAKPNPRPTTTIRPIPQPLQAPSFQSQSNVQSQLHLQPAPQFQTKPQILAQGQFPFQSQRHPHSNFQSQSQVHPQHQFQSQPHFPRQHRFHSTSHLQSQFQPQPQFNPHHQFQHHPQSHTQHRFSSQPHFQSQINHFPQSQLVAQSSSISQTNIDPKIEILKEPIVKVTSTPDDVKENTTKSPAVVLPETPSGTSLLPESSSQPQLSPQQLAQILKQLLQ